MPLQSALASLLGYVIGDDDAQRLIATVRVAPALASRPVGNWVDRATVAQGLVLVLVADLLRRVPAARTYVDGLADEPLYFDHAVVHTVGQAGDAAPHASGGSIERILRALGFAAPSQAEGAAAAGLCRCVTFVQQDAPDLVPRIVLEQIDASAFGAEFHATAHRVFGAARDPLSPELAQLLQRMEAQGRLDFHDATDLVLRAARCFDRQHVLPHVADYEVLLQSSSAAAWVATEGQAFHHLTRSVPGLPDLQALAVAGFEVRQTREPGHDGRARPMAVIGTQFSRRLKGPRGREIERTVPGSFLQLVAPPHHPTET